MVKDPRLLVPAPPPPVIRRKMRRQFPEVQFSYCYYRIDVFLHLVQGTLFLADDFSRHGDSPAGPIDLRIQISGCPGDKPSTNMSPAHRPLPAVEQCGDYDYIGPRRTHARLVDNAPPYDHRPLEGVRIVQYGGDGEFLVRLFSPLGGYAVRTSGQPQNSQEQCANNPAATQSPDPLMSLPIGSLNLSPDFTIRIFFRMHINICVSPVNHLHERPDCFSFERTDHLVRSYCAFR